MFKVEQRFLIDGKPVTFLDSYQDIKIYETDDQASAYVVKNDIVLFRIDADMSQGQGSISGVSKLAPTSPSNKG
jgi:hypothetical protein